MNDKVATPKLIGRMRKLLVMAEHLMDTANNEGQVAAAKVEADRARAKVFELMAEYDISQEYLDAIEDAPDELKLSKRFDLRKPFIQKGRLMNILAQQNHVIVVLGAKPKTTVQWITAYGFKQDVERFEMIWLSILTQGEREYAKTRIPVGVHPPTFKRGWWEGFTVAIFNRITAEKRKIHSVAAPGTELIHVKRDEDVEDFVTQQTGGTRKGRRSSTRTFHGNREGYSAGQRVDFGGSSVGTATDRTAIG